MADQGDVKGGTGVPHFALASEYLRSLVSVKKPEYELEETASERSSHGSPPPELTARDADSGDWSASQLTINPGDTHRPSFFVECELQVRKLFAFMELHLSKVENELADTIQNMRLVASRREQKMAKATAESFIFSKSYLKVAQSESEKSQLLDLTTEEDKNDQVSISIGSMNRLKGVLLSLRDNLNSCFAALDELMTLHDDNALSHDGQSYLQSTDPKRREFESRITACLRKIESELHTQHQTNEVYVDDLGMENLVTTQVRNSPIGCITFLFLLLFLLIWGVICFMYFWNEDWTLYLRLIRSPLLIVFYVYLFGLNMKGWARAGINYVSIFAYFPNGIPTPKFVTNVAMLFSFLFSVFLIVLLFSTPFSPNIPAKLVAMVMWLSLLAFLINPLNVCLRRGRISFLMVTLRILLAPFFFVTFGDFWFADQLNSTVAFMLDFEYLLCYCISDPWIELNESDKEEVVCTQSGNGVRPLISCLPSLWRLLQCLRCYYDTRKIRHLLNAVKYATTFPVIVFATLFEVKVHYALSLANLDFRNVGWIIICWLLSSFVEALYTFIWDVYCDWGLLQISKGTLLRPKTLFPYKSLYLIAIVFNLILRFAWTLELTLAIVWHLNSGLIFTGLIVAEILRRFVWNFFRLEYEQIMRSKE